MVNSVDADPQLIAGWQPFFAVSAGAAAALAGLLFVALSIHAREIAEHPPFRYRALATLSIPLVVLVVSGLVLLRRQTRFLGLEKWHRARVPRGRSTAASGALTRNQPSLSGQSLAQ